MSMEAAIYTGDVVHQRFAPKRHRLNYRIFQVLFDLDRLDELKALRLLSHNRFNLFGFYDADHGPDKAQAKAAPLKDRMVALLRSHGLYEPGDRLFLLAMPRVLGFVFNPISLYFVQTADGAQRAIVYEVNNTFGDRHAYVLPVYSQNRHIRQTSDKKLHVSPFMDMDMTYRFDLNAPDERFWLNIRVDQQKTDTPMLFAAFTAVRRPLKDAELWRLFIVMPLLTLKVVAGIHWEAVLLLAKGLRLKPDPKKAAAAAENAKFSATQ
ncbi:DUF1365 domain-containing protein [Asticcacaulis sp. EMRT-3]|uniref:DUF1365 domain-containing protein n=1 Tax=Asticcacaulis sp. EMRT-3 TaxID=3040349 RepID=UPI0024AF7B64|nr:DUF1365 domain-containing protein [Asticcacaulis sp. EMRT-3]MDI7775858.1 DUF1365 domain-containing protein [Asticcacaulis sp. EMRT-3]